jgi:hypothetical protein
LLLHHEAQGDRVVILGDRQGSRDDHPPAHRPIPPRLLFPALDGPPQVEPRDLGARHETISPRGRQMRRDSRVPRGRMSTWRPGTARDLASITRSRAGGGRVPGPSLT